MFHELEKRDFNKAAFLFKNKLQCVPALSVIEGNYPGRVFVNNTENIQTCLVWLIDKWSYVEGILNDEILNDLGMLLKEVIFPDNMKCGNRWFEIYASQGDNEELLEDYLMNFGVKKHHETTYVLNKTKFYNMDFNSSLTALKSDFPLIPDELKKLDFINRDFFDKTTIGFVVYDKDEMVSMCISNGLAVGNTFFIEVETFSKNSRQKGYASAATYELLKYSLENNLEPLWETTELNIPSQKLAAKFGYEPVVSYPVFVMDY